LSLSRASPIEQPGLSRCFRRRRRGLGRFLQCAGGERDKEQEEGSNISGAAAVQVRAGDEAMRLTVEKGAVKGADGWVPHTNTQREVTVYDGWVPHGRLNSFITMDKMVFSMCT
jgi:hypothetical protein